MKFRAVSLLLLALLAGSARAEPEAAPFKASAPLSLELFNAQWFDGQAFKKGTLFVVDGVFTAKKPARVNRRMDLKNQYVIPPLAEAHNYNLQSDWGVSHYEQRYLSEGVFYAAMLCADPADVGAIRKKLSDTDSPDVLFATACITSSDGQPLANLLTPKVRMADIADKAVLIMDKPEQVEQKWKLVAPRKPDMVKVVLSYIDKPELRGKAELRGKLGMDAETVTAVVRHAHQSNLKVMAQVDDAADFEAAVRAGVDLIAHLPGYFNPYGDGPERFLISTDVAALAAQQKIGVVTATAATTLFKTTPEQLSTLRQTQTRNLLTLKSAGIQMLLGSDVFTATALLELHNLASLGVFSNAELLRMATQDTPRALFPSRKLGCFDSGCEASFLLLASNPLQDLDAVDTPLLRVKQGRLLTQLADVAQSSDATTESTDGKKKAAPKKKTSRAKSKASAKPASKPASATAGKATSKATRKTAKATANNP